MISKRHPQERNPAVSGTRIGTRELYFWSLLIVGVAYWVNIVRGSSPGELPDLASVLSRVLENGAFDVAAWAMIFAGFTAAPDTEPASRPRILATFLLGIIVLAPARLATAAALVMLGCLLLRDRRAPPVRRHIGLVLLALAVETIWTSRLFAPLHVFVGGLDARLCAVLSHWLGFRAIAHANVVDNVSANFSIAIWPYCASSFPLAGVGLAFLVTCLYLGGPPRRRHLPFLGLALVSSVVLSEIRLAVLATGQANYEWWHLGPGATIYVLAALALAVVFHSWRPGHP